MLENVLRWCFFVWQIFWHGKMLLRTSWGLNCLVVLAKIFTLISNNSYFNLKTKDMLTMFNIGSRWLARKENARWKTVATKRKLIWFDFSLGTLGRDGLSEDVGVGEGRPVGFCSTESVGRVSFSNDFPPKHSLQSSFSFILLVFFSSSNAFTPSSSFSLISLVFSSV